MDEKSKIVTDAGAEPPFPNVVNQTAPDLDQAFWYVQESSNRDAPYPASASDLKALRRKIDWHIVPIMFCCYTMQFIDKVLLNVSHRFSCCAIAARLTKKQYAAIMGLNKDLKLKGNDFTNAATAFFIAYLVADILNGISSQPCSHLPIES